MKINEVVLKEEYVLFINGKPVTKYVEPTDASADIAHLKKKFPNHKIELKKVVTRHEYDNISEDTTDTKYPDNKNGVVAMLNAAASSNFIQELDLANCEISPDPQVDGVWKVDNHENGIRVIVYLAGYREPSGNIRKYNDFEDGDIPERERRTPKMDLYKLSNDPEQLTGYDQRGQIFDKGRKIKEAKKFTRNARRSLVRAAHYPDLSGSYPYAQYRFGVALAAAPGQKVDSEGPAADDLITIAYTDADQEILNHAKKSFGIKSKAISRGQSKELKGTNTQSPMRPQPPVKRKNK